MGRPIKVRMGTENNDPPPPTVFRKAAKNPTRMIRGYSYQLT
jgi:hypothetical protein